MKSPEPCSLRAGVAQTLVALAWVSLVGGFTINANAAVTPLSVGPSGAGPFTFDTQPFLSNGWSTLSIAGLNTSISTAAALDAAVNTNAAAGIATQLPPDSTTPTPTF